MTGATSPSLQGGVVDHGRDQHRDKRPLQAPGRLDPKGARCRAMIDCSEELDRAAARLKDALVARIDSNVPPPNAPATIRKKGHDHTLIDTGEYKNSIEIKVEPDGFEVGVFDPEIAKRAFWNEHGTDRIPARPVFGPVADGPVGRSILDDLEEEIADKFELELSE